MMAGGGSAAGTNPLAAGPLSPGAKGSMAAFLAAMPGGAGTQAGTPAAGYDQARQASFARFMAAPGGGQSAPATVGPASTGLSLSETGRLTEAVGTANELDRPAGKPPGSGARGGQPAAMQGMAGTGSSSARARSAPAPKTRCAARSSPNGGGRDSAATGDSASPTLPGPAPGSAGTEAADRLVAEAAMLLPNGGNSAHPATADERLYPGTVSGTATGPKAAVAAQTAGTLQAADRPAAEAARLSQNHGTPARSCADEAPPQSGADETPVRSEAKAQAPTFDEARTSAIPATTAAGAEKFAALSAAPSKVKATNGQAPDKKTLIDGIKSDTKQDTALGTTGARPASTMTAQTFARSFAAFGTGVAISGAAAGAGIKGNSTAADSPAPASTAREAVAAVVRIADTQAGRADAQAHVVNMSFKIGGEDLSVRVELHGTEVRTQFSTSSAELRAALSGEWQGTGPGGGSHNLTFAEPEFTQSAASSSGSFAEGGAGYRGRDREGEGSAPAWTSTAADSAGLESADVSPVSPSIPPGASAHLRAFA